MNTLRYVRYLLEMISVPIFFVLVAHMSGHGSLLLFEEGHDHHEEHEAGHGFEIADLLTQEVLIGVLFTLVFTWIWHRRGLKHLVPCSHEHCHDTHIAMHILAIVALCLHFFPESALRVEFFHDVTASSVQTSIAYIGFLSHFIIDIIVALVISSYWKRRWQQVVSFIMIALVWQVAALLGDSLFSGMSELSEGILLLLSAFVLAMFIHKPHKPDLHCHKC